MLTLAENIKAARAAAKLSQQKLADAAGVSQSLIGALETGKVKSTADLPEIAAALRVTPGDLDPRFQDAPQAPARKPEPEFFGDRDFKIFAATQGGPSGEVVVDNEPYEIVQRPWYMKEVRVGYGVVVTGDSMSPKFEPGDIAVVNPKAPLLRGKVAIFVDEEHGEFRALIKQLVRETSTDWHVLQHNPPEGETKEFKLSKKRWRRALRVVGTYDGA